MNFTTRARRLWYLYGKRCEPSRWGCRHASSEMRKKSAALSLLLCDTAEDVHERYFHLLRERISQMPQQSQTLSSAVLHITLSR